MPIYSIKVLRIPVELKF